MKLNETKIEYFGKFNSEEKNLTSIGFSRTRDSKFDLVIYTISFQCFHHFFFVGK